uniref:Uncharacterized protein n=1 Tax=Chromera velia CCMP2878 TaxID=1169474 RepID=A0A0G4G5W2_9ALVE|eukprot:Cvel_4182.t1-p1 / transcript=Cvel_4182.t1 / gene=Cvel_4182 / organism=Chromera_velia_CCMP2878 / gene_product=hypothetical protein / transcript_product=hypothetical protein / location=Cvel_scaffold180:58238-59164(+) / protein_length=309 / sequence_SO=supercontig / SO=protein_coding / is_pseudo=false
MLISFGIVAACVSAQRFVHFSPKLLGRSGVDLMKAEFSGQAVFREGYVWTLVTGSLLHSDLSHEVNNLIFTFVVSVVLESQMGGPLTILIFLSTGAAGWMCSAAWHWWQYGEMGLWTAGNGCSPNMYGLAFFVATLEPGRVFPRTLLFLPVWIWCASVWVLPPLLSRRMFDRKSGKVDSTHLLYVSSLCAVLLCFVSIPRWDDEGISAQQGKDTFTLGGSGQSIKRFLSFGDLTAAGYLAQYQLRCVIETVYVQFVRKSQGLSDHWCHLGGALAGIVFALLSAPLEVFPNLVSDVLLIVSLILLLCRAA